MTAIPTTLEPSTPELSAARAPARLSARPQSLRKAHMELGKVRLNAMVVFTTALGYIVGIRTTDFGINWAVLAWTCLGTFLAAVGASAFNQAIEARRDALMHRTRNRPLCTGRLTRTYAAAFGLIVSMCGVVLLAFLTTPLAAVLAAFNVALYAIIYTPLKPLSTANTLVGAVVGGVPPVLGWAAATGTITPGALVLGSILFVWQVPHFLALCWMYRDDYARGGFRMLPIVDRTGKMTSRLALIYSVLLFPLCLLMVGLQHADIAFAAISCMLTVFLIFAAMRFAITRGNRDARRLFFASIIYLPLVSLTLMLDARQPMTGYDTAPAGYVLRQATPPFIDPGTAGLHPATH